MSPDHEQRIRAACAQVADTLCAKHRDYGQSGLRVPALAPWLSPLEGLLCRQSDKYARIGTLIQSGRAEVAETLEETGFDQVGYAVLIYLAIQDRQAETGRPLE